MRPPGGEAYQPTVAGQFVAAPDDRNGFQPYVGKSATEYPIGSPRPEPRQPAYTIERKKKPADDGMKAQQQQQQQQQRPNQQANQQARALEGGNEADLVAAYLNEGRQEGEAVQQQQQQEQQRSISPSFYRPAPPPPPKIGGAPMAFAPPPQIKSHPFASRHYVDPKEERRAQMMMQAQQQQPFQPPLMRMVPAGGSPPMMYQQHPAPHGVVTMVQRSVSPPMRYQSGPGMHADGDAYSTYPSQGQGPDEQEGGFYYPAPSETIYAQDSPRDVPNNGGTYQQPHPARPQHMGGGSPPFAQMTSPPFGMMAAPPSTILPRGGEQIGTPQFGVMAAPPSMMLPPVHAVSYPPNPLAVHGSPAQRRAISPGRPVSDSSIQTDPVRDLGIRYVDRPVPLEIQVREVTREAESRREPPREVTREVQVPVYVEKIVDRTIEVPKVVEHIIEVPVPVEKIVYLDRDGRDITAEVMVTGNSSSLLQNTSNILNSSSSGVNGSSSGIDHAPKTGDYYASNENYANLSGDTSGRLLSSSNDAGRSISPNNTGRSVSPGRDLSGAGGHAEGPVMARIKMVTIPLNQERGPSPPQERPLERGRGVSQERVGGTREYVRSVSPHEGGDRRRSSSRGDLSQPGARVVVASARGQALPSENGSITYVTDNRRMRSESPPPGGNRRRSTAMSEHEEMAGVGLVLKRSREGVYTVVKTVPGHQAEQHGSIRANDEILRIDGVQTAGLSWEKMKSLSNGPVGSVCVIEYASGGGDSISRRRYTVALERMLGIEGSGRGGETGEGGGGGKISKFDPGEIISKYSAVELRSEGQPSQTGSFRALANSMGNHREHGSSGGWEGGGDLGSFEGGSLEMNRQAHQRIMEIQSHNDAASDQIRRINAANERTLQSITAEARNEASQIRDNFLEGARRQHESSSSSGMRPSEFLAISRSSGGRSPRPLQQPLGVGGGDVPVGEFNRIDVGSVGDMVPGSVLEYA